jgi:nucleoside-diphosphate-sugar epimerase
MKVLITGATGFIGSFLAGALAAAGHDVACIVRDRSRLKWLEHPGIRTIQADLDKRDSYASELADLDYIFHLAGVTKAASDHEFFHANSECTRRFAETAADSCRRLKRFLHVSSLAAAGPSLDSLPLTEDMQPHPVSAYGKSKLEGENAVLSLRDSMPVTVIRPPAVYGPRDTDFFLVFRAVQNRVFPYWGEGRYSLIYVHDLVSGIITAAEKEKSSGNIYYLADKKIYTNDDILAAMTRVLGRKALRIRLPRAILPAISMLVKKISKKGIINPDKMQEIRFPDWTCDPAKAERDFGFHTSTALEEGFTKTAEWYRKEKWL